MSESEGTAVLVALFALRCVLPLAITLAFGYFMNRLVDRWNAEDLARQPEAPEVETPVTQPRSSIKLPTVTIPCWVLNNCEEKAREGCAAYNQPGIPCFLARLRADGKLPAGCADCEIYAKAMTVPVRA